MPDDTSGSHATPPPAEDKMAIENDDLQPLSLEQADNQLQAILEIANELMDVNKQSKALNEQSKELDKKSERLTDELVLCFFTMLRNKALKVLNIPSKNAFNNKYLKPRGFASSTSNLCWNAAELAMSLGIIPSLEDCQSLLAVAKQKKNLRIPLWGRVSAKSQSGIPTFDEIKAEIAAMEVENLYEIKKADLRSHYSLLTEGKTINQVKTICHEVEQRIEQLINDSLGINTFDVDELYLLNDLLKTHLNAGN